MGRLSSDERRYLKRDAGVRGLKSSQDVFPETGLHVACYMAKSSKNGLKLHGKTITKGISSIKDKAITSMHAAGTVINF